MFKYFFIFVILCHTRGHAVPQEEVLQRLPALFKSLPLLNSLQNATDPDNSTEDGCNKVLVKINGSNNINAGVQVILVNVETTIVAKANVNPAGYLVTPGVGAHKLQTDSLTWNDARQTCIQEGGHLAVINSVSEEEILLRMLRDNGIDAAWLGVHDFYKKGEWVTVTDEALKNTGYAKWAANGPNSDANRQNCAALKEGGMTNELCDVLVPFFCEIAV